MSAQATTMPVIPKSGKKMKITGLTAVLMIGVALIIDLLVLFINLLHFIPVVGNFFASMFGYLIGLTAGMIFTFWFFLKGVKLMTPKRILSMGSGWLIAIIPVLNTLPGWTIAITATIASSRV